MTAPDRLLEATVLAAANLAATVLRLVLLRVWVWVWVFRASHDAVAAA